MSPRKLAVVVLAVVANGCSNVVESESSQFGVVVVSGHLFADPHNTAQAHCSKFGKNAIQKSSRFYSNVGLGGGSPAVLTSYDCLDPRRLRAFAEARRELELQERRYQELQALAEQNDAEALFSLSLLAQSNKEEWKWLCLAANQGHAIAQGKVGQEYWPVTRSIEIVGPDLNYAYMWFSLAATNGHEYASNWRDNLAKSMSTDQITEGERLAVEWEPDLGARSWVHLQPASCHW